MDHNVTLTAEVVAGPHRKFLFDWRKRFIAAREAAYAYAKSVGGVGFQPGHNGNLIGVVFDDPRKVPRNWVRKSNSKCTYYRPHKRLAYDAMKAIELSLPSHPAPDDIRQGLGLINTLSFETKDGSGSSVIGHFFEPVQACWVSDKGKMWVVFPDAAAARKLHLIENPDDKVTNIPANWKPPIGLKVLTESEFELAWAREKVKFEKESGK